MEFEKLKKIFSDQPIPEKQGRVRGNKNIFKVGLIDLSLNNFFALLKWSKALYFRALFFQFY